MRLRLASLVLLLFSSVACHKESPPPSDHPRLTPNVRMQDVSFHSASLQRDMPYRVILPTNFSPGQKLPVVYLLHGGAGTYRDWSNYSDVSQFAAQGLLLVMPQADESYYMNAAQRPADKYEDYITRDLVADVQRLFPAAADRGRRAIVGVSMGGFGAITLAMKHLDLYGFAAGISSAIDVPSRPFSLKRMSQYRGHAQIFGPWGSPTRKANDPYLLAASVDPAGMPYFYLTCGEQEGLLPANQRFAALLKKRGFKSEFHPGAGGHDWNQWNRRLPELFEKLQQQIAR